ncbi:MAG: S-methyl-5-thioribose-1-phosphate isomerase [Candidatus Margulisbacteria bacterium]|nr:S-methyl-5-thioribose-1-phosphate isomerase [Candidatus Margulisiibacteriota bacterium]
MKVNNKIYRTVWLENRSVFMIDQTLLPFEFKIFEAKNYHTTCQAIKTMIVRGAGAIGAAAGYAMAQAFFDAPDKGFKEFIAKAKTDIENTRPTAQNLFYATNRVCAAAFKSQTPRKTAVQEAHKIANEDADNAKRIGELGSGLIRSGFKLMTHCNAGWLAFVDWGTALAPTYVSHHNSKNVFVYVSETRPRSQGAKLTAWELKNEGIDHAIIADAASASFISQRKVDLIIVGADRIAANGDVANKTGTLAKAIIAKEYNIPFYVAAPTSTIDLDCQTGRRITIEQRSEDEVLYQTGLNSKGKIEKILVCSPGSKALNPAFDVTPAQYITGLITEKGIIKPDNNSIAELLSQ